jgi:riboflavin kinase/FMN adenylyltransferase
VHLLDYHGNLYGQQLTIEFICRLRGEQHFDSAESLIEQLKKDAIQAKQLL